MRRQAIRDHHRPPARTQLGVGDEKEALWAAAGGREDLAPSVTDPDDAVGFGAALVVDGRPTFDPLPPAPVREKAAAPEQPRHPTPRMMPVAAPPPSATFAPAPPSSQPSSLAAYSVPASSVASPSFETFTPARRGMSTAVVVLLVVFGLGALALGVLFLTSRP
jgi:hypothetical protein